MSTITRELAKLFRKITNSEIDAEGNAHVVLSPADSLLINNARIALASLEAEPVAYIRDGFRADGVHFCGGIISAKEYERTKPALSDRYNWKHQPLYAAPPAPVAVPECFKRLLHHAYGMTMGHDWNKGTMAGHHRAKLCQAVDECRAAMLHGADGTLTNEGTMQLSGNSEQIEPVSNRDELPDGWVACSERMPDRGKKVLIRISCSDHFNIESGEYKGDGLWFGCWFDTYGKKGSAYQVAHWMPLPAAPQQEMK
ncbi:DUF551 domain-containing protein [Citrobacter freundii]|uniref:DUF551 domain-containing protein n=1 Tax=Citrobacter freundii TaxID=546 RepID=UPI00155E03F7|nr:DUF551 domain-containing protein [Citrobacter freundii]